MCQFQMSWTDYIKQQLPKQEGAKGGSFTKFEIAFTFLPYILSLYSHY